MTTCDVCKRDIFPRVATREMGARCVEHAVGLLPDVCLVCLFRHCNPCIPQEG